MKKEYKNPEMEFICFAAESDICVTISSVQAQTALNKKDSTVINTVGTVIEF